jgi:tetratricopeptide (TPR) repeat protein
MSLFIDVVETLSSKVKAGLNEIIGNERKKQDRPVRKICDLCIKYLKYGDLVYYRMEESISRLQENNVKDNPLNPLLMAVLNESLDEDQEAVQYLCEFSDSPLAEPFRAELTDFITIGKFVTLYENVLLEEAGLILVERYTDENTVTDTLSNLYLNNDAKEYIPLFQKLLNRAKELYPANIQLESFNSFLYIKDENYDKALETSILVKEKLEQDKENRFYNFNLASAWDNIAGCYLKQGNPEKTIESCDVALSYNEKAEGYTVENSILQKKAGALLLQGEKDQALVIVDQILDINEEDEKALDMKKKITGA